MTSIYKLDLSQIVYSPLTKRFLYNGKSLTFITPWLTCKEIDQDYLKIKHNSKFMKYYTELYNHCTKLSNTNFTQLNLLLKIHENIGWFDYKIQKETVPLDHSLINEYCQVRLELKLFLLNGELNSKIENCAFKLQETIDFQSCSELSDVE